MNQTRGSIQFLSFALVSLAAIACGRERTPDHAGPNTTVTSAKVPAATPDPGTGDDSVCETPSDEPLARGPVTRSAVLLPAVSAASKAKHKLDAIAKPARSDNDENASSLHEAIVAAVGNDAHEDATPPEAIAAQVTTTGATVPRAQSAETLAPSRIAFESRLPASYRLERVRMLVDGAIFYDGRSAASVQLAAGDHVVELIADYRLSDPVFTYVDGYRVELRSTEVVPASRAPIAYVATASPTGGVTTPMNKRAALAWRSFAAR